MRNQINKSEVFKNAWKIFKANGTRTMAAFSAALKEAWKIVQTQIVKRIILSINSVGIYGYSKNVNPGYNLNLFLFNELREKEILETLVGFESALLDIARKVNRFWNVSEKQSWCLAKWAIENYSIQELKAQTR